MKIIDVIKQSAELLGLEQITEILNSATLENEAEILQNEEVNRMLNLSALSIQELCSNYISVYVEEEIETTEQKYPLNKLNNFVKIINLYKDGESVKFKVINRNIIVEDDGKYTIRYCAYPDIKSLFDEIDFLSEFSPDVLVMGVCSYYAISHGMYNEFETFHEQYIDKATAIKHLKLFELPLRRWE